MKAFPNPTLSDTQHNSADSLNDPSEYGMDLRDYFAAKAIQGILASGVTIDIDKETIGITRAKTAYVIADAMMEAREQ